MPMGQSTFTADNLVAILTAAPKGGTVEQVIERAGCDVSAASVKKWISDGKRDHNAGKSTAYALFFQQWESIYPGAPPRGEAERMDEMRKALQKLGIQAAPPAAQNGRRANGYEAAAPSAPRRSRKVCECGNPKESSAVSCTACLVMDSNNRRGVA